MYNVPEHGNADVYLIQGSESNPHLKPPILEQIEAMYNEGAPEFVVEPGLYYPTPTNYGYYCTGFESPGEWDDHHKIFCVDGPDIQYSGGQTDSSPYVYYTPSYGYAQSPYNPYNPYIPGAMIGVDSPFVGTQQYYSMPSYQNPVSGPGYFPLVVQSRPDTATNVSPDPILDAPVSLIVNNRPDAPVSRHNIPSPSTTFTITPQKPTSNQPLGRPRANSGPSKQLVTNGSATSGSFLNPASSHIMQGKNSSGPIQDIPNVSHGRVPPHRNQSKVGLPVGNSLSDLGSSVHGQADKLRPKFLTESSESLGEQNRGPRTNRSKNQLAVKAYTTKVGDGNGQGNIISSIDQFNKDDLPDEYPDAKFFVIKSYSEDDVHKSIKYGVWSSTPNGNKRLESAYEDAQRIDSGQSKGCPIFLFFSVNASGQFCGVAEMTGPVDFHKDMDFWQQDKWTGSFPVKWHIIKDVPNTNFRHIILENNENKPVTNSRDTQEIRYKQGLEMLKIFKNYTMKTSLLDDFMYYENRQKLMKEEKARLLTKSYDSPFFVPAFDPPRKLNLVVDLPSREDEKVNNRGNDENSEKSLKNSAITSCSMDETEDTLSTLKIGSLTINPKQSESNSKQFVASSSTTASTGGSEHSDVVTVGSMPVKVNGFAESSGFLTVGTIPLDPRALQYDKSGTSKGGFQQ